MMIARSAVIEVPGRPQTKGSAKAIQRKGMAYPVIINDNAKCKSWERSVKLIAKSQWKGEPSTLPVYISVIFYLKRPKNHHVANDPKRPVKDSSPKRHQTKPDIDKMLRAILDSLTGVVWVDDSQVDEVSASKLYDENEGVFIFVTESNCKTIPEGLE